MKGTTDMPRKKPENGTDGQQPPSFEQALEGLESIVESMEHDPLSLEELVAHYEKGAAYLSHCESILQSARKRIELITLRNQNEIALDADLNRGEDPLSAEASSVADDTDDDDDIRLF